MTDHEWFNDRIAERLAGGLPQADRARFESHLSSCPACATEYTAAERMEKTMTQLFAPIAPAVDFEDRLIARLRSRAPRLRISPAIRRAVVAACAAIVLGGMGYTMSQRLQNGTLPMWSMATGPKVASNLHQIGQANMLDIRRGLASVNSIDLRGDEQLYGDGHVEYQQNPFAGVAKDMIYGRKENSAKSPADGVAGYGPNRSEEKQAPAATPALTPALAVESPVALNVNNRVQLSGDQTRKSSESLYVAPQQQVAASTPANHPAIFWENKSQVGNYSYFKPTDPGLSAKTSATDHDIDVLRSAPATAGKELNTTLAFGDGIKDADNNGIKDDIKQQVAANPATDAPTATNKLLPQAAPPPPTEPPAQSQPAPATQPSQKIIRNGEMEFEVDSFDSAAATVSKIVAEEGGAVATVNSEKLPNGKVKGIVTIRVAPDHLDTLVLKLRALGDLKRQNLTAEDVTKQYTDTASELRAARAMEERLLNIIKTSQGQVKDLLAVEKELATWREKIEKAEGEIRYYDNLVAMSTLNISISERDIKTAAAATESEQVSMGVEADDVEAARNEAIKAIEDAKGRITESELKKLDAGQLAAQIVADIKPDAAGPAIDRLKQLGRVARLESSRRQIIAPGGLPDSTTKLEKGDTHLILSLYNLANIAPRQTTILNMASDDVEQTYQAILARVAKAGGRVVTSNLNRQTDQQTGGTIQLEVKSADADAVLNDIRALGEVVRLNAVENPDTNNVTAAKRGINIELSSLAAMMPREVNNRLIASADVTKSRQALLDALRPMKSRIIVSKLEDAGQGKLNCYLDFEVRRADVVAAEKALAGAGETYDRRVDTSADAQNVTDAKVQFKLQIVESTTLPPRQIDTLAIEVTDVDAAAQGIQGDATSLGGRVIDSSSAKDDKSQTARLILEVPLSRAGEILTKARALGAVRTNQQSSNAQAPAGELGRERLELALASGEALVAPDQGIFASIRHGFVISFAGLMWSLQLIVIGLCFVLPWALLIWGGMRIVKRRKPVSATASV